MLELTTHIVGQGAPHESRQRKRAFSLLELLISIAIIFIMFTLYFGGGGKQYQVKKMEECEKNLQNVYVAVQTFARENKDALPATNARTSETPLSALVPRYTTGSEFFICPGSKDKPLPDAQPFADRKISYAYYMGRQLSDGADKALLSDEQVNTSSKTNRQLVFSLDGKKIANNHDKYGGNFLFCDGHVQSTGPLAAFDLTFTNPVVLLNPKP
jgi:prepilin-type processing-associated H-X9-DG protein